MKRRTLIRKLVLGTFLTGATVVIALKLVFSDATAVVQSINPSRFDAATWRTGDLRTRGTMVRDLIERELLIGKSRQEAVGLLGPPDQEAERLLTYNVDLGHKFGSTPWLYALQLRIDAASGRVLEAWYTD
jgi:hypothetical protein